jgi:glycerol uptake facilitator-like aquaporin
MDLRRRDLLTAAPGSWGEALAWIDRASQRSAGLTIGLAVAADILGGGPLTGAAMNPARWLGPAVASSTFDSWFVWWLGPIVGAAIAAIAYRFLLLPTADAERHPAHPG